MTRDDSKIRNVIIKRFALTPDEAAALHGRTTSELVGCAENIVEQRDGGGAEFTVDRTAGKQFVANAVSEFARSGGPATRSALSKLSGARAKSSPSAEDPEARRERIRVRLIASGFGVEENN